MGPNSPQRAERVAPAWWIFALSGLFFLAYGVYAFSLPTAEPAHWDDITRSADTIRYLAANFRWIGLLSAMFGILSLALAYGGLRRAARWVWFARLSYPVFFVFAIFFTWPGLLWTPFLLLAIIALWLSYRPASRP